MNTTEYRDIALGFMLPNFCSIRDAEVNVTITKGKAADISKEKERERKRERKERERGGEGVIVNMQISAN
jgi:hypothetical protein